jgi:hypothetical protein
VPREAEVEVDQLYQLPLAEFTAARNALAGARKTAGDADAAATIKSLSKPSVSAWVVNQLWWRQRALFDDLLAAGDAAREAAERGAGPAEQQATAARRREALRALLRAAEQQLTEAGHGTSSATLRKITTTLEACAAYGTHLPAPGPGRFADDLSPPGFDVLASLSGLPPPAPAPEPEPAPAPPPDPKPALAAAVDAATKYADEARIALDDKLEVYADLERRAVAARRAADEAKREMDRAQKAANEADRAVLEARARLRGASA